MYVLRTCVYVLQVISKLVHRTGLEAKDAKQIAALRNNEKARTGYTVLSTKPNRGNGIPAALRLVIGFSCCVANDNDAEPRALYAAQPHHRLQRQGNS